jgi:hypothetical protein
MSLNKKSVAAFLFMPQFHLCFQGLSHLYPVFMRILALMFTQAGILPHNHPATRYGIAGVKKYSVSELIGEAWYNLRNRRGATPYQWGVFASIIVMMGAFIGAIGNFVFTVAFGAANVAQAQLFSNALIPDTSIGFVQTMGPPPAGAVFDKRIGASAQNGAYGYNDYALIMLDKILRSSAATPQTGGSLQNGITALFQVYNTAITIIAAVMIFWIITSIVVDTAKTGVVGGGRHNMVWAPIRIVFALGLMIPLGTVGYSSGQYCVMKLAEWGSNLGSNGWRAYVMAVTGVNDLLAPTTPENVSGVVNGIVASQVCRVAYNTYVEASTGTTTTSTATPNPNVLIHPVNSISPDRQSLQRAWTNKNDGNLCGMLVIPMGANALGLGFSDDATRIMTVASLATQFGNGNNYLNIAQTARAAALAAVGANVVPTLEPPALRFACAFVPHAMSAATPVAGAALVNRARNATGPGWQNGINSWNGTTWTAGAAPTVGASTPVTMGAVGSLCNGNNNAAPCSTAISAGPPSSPKPNLSCHMAMNLLMSGTTGLVTNAINAAAAIFSNYLSGNASTANTIMNNMMQRGWGGMGIWFNELASINLTHQALSAPNISVVPGKLASGAAECQQNYQSPNSACKLPAIDRETALVMAQYQAWYEKLATQAPLPLAGAAMNLATAGLNGRYLGTGDIRQEQAEQVDKPSFPGMMKMAWWIGTGQSQKVMDAIIRRVFGLDNTRTYLWTNLVGDINDATYPLVNMVVVGNKMLVSGGGILIGATVGQALLGLVPPGLGLAGSIIFDFAKMCAYTLMTTGMLLTLYVPVLPTIRVAFSVMTWMVSVFEATVMVPIACLAHLTTEGDGLAGAAKNCWILWLNVLTRPILTVFGFIGAFLIFNAWVVYFTNAFAAAAMQSTSQSNVIIQILCQQFYSVMYVTICYSAANASFKMLDIIPNALFRWMPGAQGDFSFDSDGGAADFTKGTAESFVGAKGVAAGASQDIVKFGKDVGAAAREAAKKGAAGA